MKLRASPPPSLFLILELDGMDKRENKLHGSVGTDKVHLLRVAGYHIATPPPVSRYGPPYRPFATSIGDCATLHLKRPYTA